MPRVRQDSTSEAWLKFDASLRDLIAEARHGNARAFEQLYLATASWLLWRVRRLVNDGQAEDVLAEVYLQAWRSLDSFDAERGAATAWLAMIARSRALDHLRYERSRPAQEITDLGVACESCDEPDSCLSRAQDERFVRASMSGLNCNERLVIDLAYFRDWTHTEIAQSTGLPIGTVKTLIARARGKLRTRLAAPTGLRVEPAMTGAVA